MTDDPKQQLEPQCEERRPSDGERCVLDAHTDDTHTDGLNPWSSAEQQLHDNDPGAKLHAVVSSNLHVLRDLAQSPSDVPSSPIGRKAIREVWLLLDAAHREYLLSTEHGLAPSQNASDN
jgi:hypothetical protein